MFVCCECCVLSGRGLCDRLITRPEESYRLWCVVVCDHETSKTRRLNKARYRPVKIQPRWVVTPTKQQQQHISPVRSNTIEVPTYQQLTSTVLDCKMTAKCVSVQ